MTTKFSSTARLKKLSLASGTAIIDDICSTILQTAKYEVIFATCFWAESSSLLSVADLLRDLSRKAMCDRVPQKIKVRICISSATFWQKVFHTSSTRGHLYPPSSWPQQLKLPPQEDLPGLDLQVKSVFIKPFSVIHSKYVIIDRETAIFPSCNVSFEEWFEGAVTVQGPIVGQLFSFWRSFWATGTSTFDLVDIIATGNDGAPGFSPLELGQIETQRLEPKPHHISIHVPIEALAAALLPSPHHRNPRFRLWPWQKAVKPPGTTLNHFVCQCIQNSKRSLFFQTPNFTCRSVIDATLNAVKRGVEVHIVTNSRLMTLEQLVTAGTTTPRSMGRLVHSVSKINGAERTSTNMEEGHVKLGKLTLVYFDSLSRHREQAFSQLEKSHLKLTIVDEEITILGSGNMDRASWYTSQELGVAFHSPDLSKALLQHTQQTFIGS